MTETLALAESTGIDRATGAVITGWDHVVQSMEVIFTTPYFSRVMRPHVGSGGLRLFGELANVRTAQRFRFTIALALSLLEPRFSPTRILQSDLDRTGATIWTIEGIYRPRGHLGDPTPADRRSLSLIATAKGLSLTGA